MLSPKEFVARWGNGAPLIQFPKAALERISLLDDDRVFLTQAGLPDSAAPFLSFNAPKSGELPTVSKQWNQSQALAAYRVIGSDGCGNPITLNEDGEVVYLDHESKFAKVLVNKSIRQLAESLLAYRKLVKNTQEEFGEDAYLDGKISSAARDTLRHELAQIDPAAMKPGCFWHAQLQDLDANAG